MLRCDNPFWKFSLAVYTQPGVAAECLALQSALNIDVNVLLFCAWLGAEKNIALDDEALAAIEDQVRRWHEIVVRPLRAVRQTMKPMPEMAADAVKELRKEIAAAELRAEQIEQDFLFDLAPSLLNGPAMQADAATAVSANVALFVQRNATAGSESPPTPLLIAAAIGYHA